MQTSEGPRWWNAESGELAASRPQAELVQEVLIPFKRLKGRMRAEASAIRQTREN